MLLFSACKKNDNEPAQQAWQPGQDLKLTLNAGADDLRVAVGFNQETKAVSYTWTTDSRVYAYVSADGKITEITGPTISDINNNSCKLSLTVPNSAFEDNPFQLILSLTPLTKHEMYAGAAEARLVGPDKFQKLSDMTQVGFLAELETIDPKAADAAMPTSVTFANKGTMIILPVTNSTGSAQAVTVTMQAGNTAAVAEYAWSLYASSGFTQTNEPTSVTAPSIATGATDLMAFWFAPVKDQNLGEVRINVNIGGTDITVPIARPTNITSIQPGSYYYLNDQFVLSKNAEGNTVGSWQTWTPPTVTLPDESMTLSTDDNQLLEIKVVGTGDMFIDLNGDNAPQETERLTSGERKEFSSTQVNAAQEYTVYGKITELYVDGVDILRVSNNPELQKLDAKEPFAADYFVYNSLLTVEATNNVKLTDIALKLAKGYTMDIASCTALERIAYKSVSKATSTSAADPLASTPNKSGIKYLFLANFGSITAVDLTPFPALETADINTNTVTSITGIPSGLKEIRTYSLGKGTSNKFAANSILEALPTLPTGVEGTWVDRTTISSQYKNTTVLTSTEIDQANAKGWKVYKIAKTTGVLTEVQ